MSPQPLSCIVVDDEQYAIDVLARYINQTPSLKLLKTFTNSSEALSWCMDNLVDLFFLDINMPEISGIEFARHMKDKAMVVICSAHSEFGVESYNHNVIDYLLKPIEYPRFMRSVQKAKEQSQNKNNNAAPAQDFILLAADSRSRMIKVNYSDIYYIESSRNYLHFHLRAQVIKTLMSLKEAEAKLPPNRFVRVHNSFLVAIDKIQFLDNYSVVLHDCPEPIPISAGYKDLVFQALNFRE